MKPETTFIFEAAKWLLRRQTDWRHNPSIRRKTLSLEGVLNTDYPPIERGKLSTHFSPEAKEQERVDTVETNGYFWLPPVLKEKNALPILAVQYYGNLTPAILSLKVMLFFPVTINETEDFKAIGYRFESPSELGEDGQSSHDYYHVQPIKKFSVSDTNLVVGCDEHILDKTPAFPLSAKSIKELLHDMLVSLYGGDITKNLMLADLLGKTFYAHAPSAN